MAQRTVIIFTYYWPPASAGGVWRFLKMSKYLKEFGWTPIIVTVNVESGAFTALDETLVDEVDPSIEVHRTKSLDPYMLYNFFQGKKGKMLPEAMSGVIEDGNWYQKLSMWIRSNLFIPDPKRGWVRYAVNKGEELIKTRHIDAIITTGPPNSLHLIGTRLKKRLEIPWVMDMRDPWTSNYMVQELMKRSSWADKIDKRLEDRALANTDCVTGISPGLLSEYESRAERTELIFNGYDDEDFPAFQSTGPDDHFIMSYIGSVKPNQNITALWKAIAELNHESEEFKKEFRLRFVGNLNPSISGAIQELGITDQLIQVNFIPHSKAINLMQSTTLLLFIVPRASYAKKITSGKIFEYLASRTPILSLGPVDGDAAWIVDKAKRKAMIDYDDKDAIKQDLRVRFQLWKESDRQLPKYTTENHLSFSRKNLTGQLAEVLNSVIETSK